MSDAHELPIRERLAHWVEHLTHVLPALARMPSEAAEHLASKGALPAIDKILEGMKGRDCFYEDLIRAVRAVVGEENHG